MPRTSSDRRAGSKAGFTLLELLIVMAIMAFALAVVLPNVRRQLSATAVQTTFFDFQRQATGLRAQAFHENQALGLVSTGEFTDDPDAEPRPAEIQFQIEDWRYEVSAPMTISAGGVCDIVEVDIFQNDNLAAHLESQPDCHYVRVAR